MKITFIKSIKMCASITGMTKNYTIRKQRKVFKIRTVYHTITIKITNNKQ